MIGIVFDTSNFFLSVGLAKDGKLVDSIEYPAWQETSEKLVYEIDMIMKRNGVAKEDVSFVSVGRGPGSYTGVRISLSVGKVMAFALGVPFYMISSLELLKDGNNKSICLMNARSKRSYVGVYDGDKAIVEDMIWENEKVMAFIKEHPDYSVSGDVEYLGLENKKRNVLDNLVALSKERNLCEDILSARPVYLKDSYPV